MAIFVLGIFLGSLFLGAGKANAQDMGTKIVLEQSKPTPGGDNVMLAKIVQYLVFKPASWFFALGGLIFNKSVEFSLNKDVLQKISSTDSSTGEEGAVSVGWRLSRDIVNLFLIFILLYIAIATILQISGYGAKELLATLIIIAFIVNFSLVITKMIIDASNVLAMEFYGKFFLTNPQSGVNEFNASTILLGRLNPGDFFAASQKYAGEKEFADLMNNFTIVFLFGGIMLVIAGFVFAALGILFIIRTAVLMILMVLAPLAFCAMILPGTKKHATDWWSSLFNQSFFAPAALFMLWLSAKVLNSGQINQFLGFTEGSNVSLADTLNPAGLNKAGWDNISLIMQFILVIVMLCASLVIAKKMGAVGAETAISWGKSAAKRAQGYAGGIARYGGRYGRRMAAPAAEKIAGGTGKISGALRRIPGVTRGLGRLAGQTRAEVGNYEKQYESYSDTTLKNLHQQLGTNRAARVAILNLLTKRGNLKDAGGFNAGEIKQSMGYATGFGAPTKDIERLRPEAAKDMDKAVSYQRQEDIPRLDKSLAHNPAFMDATIKNWKPGHLQKLVERGDEIFTEYIKTLQALAAGSNNAVDIANALRTAGNEGAARWMESGAGKSLFGWT